jgi:hypothetical protein
MDRRSILPLIALAASVALLPMTIGVHRRAAVDSAAAVGTSLSCALDRAGKPVCWKIDAGADEGQVARGSSIFCRLDDRNQPVCKLS